jgi:hypothetical protein
MSSSPVICFIVGHHSLRNRPSLLCRAPGSCCYRPEGCSVFETCLSTSQVKFSPFLTHSALRHEGVWGSGCIDPHFLDLGTSWRWVVSLTPQPLYPRGKSPRYPLDRRLGGPQSQSGKFEEEKILDPTGTRTPSPVVQPIASRYTDYATPAPTLTLSSILMSSTHLFHSLLSDRFPNLPISVLYFLKSCQLYVQPIIASLFSLSLEC